MKRLIIFITALFFAYLCGAFYSLHFDISLWTEETRASVLIFGVAFGIAVASFPFIDKLME